MPGIGDGSTAQGALATHDYQDEGQYTVSLTVTDNDGATDSASKEVDVSAPPPPNRAPQAALSVVTDGLGVEADGTTSTDPDDGALEYSWDFGDGEGDQTGSTAQHNYAIAGEYTIGLTVTDPEGLVDTATQVVNVTAPAGPLAHDSFSRTVSGNWGNPETGGTWTRTSSAASTMVSEGTGKLLGTVAGAGPGAYLPALGALDVVATVTVALDKQPTGGGTYLYFSPRYVNSANQYQLKLRITSSGDGVLQLCSISGGVVSVLDTANLPSLEYNANEKLQLKVSASGAGFTSLGAKVWKTGTSEPETWAVTASDSAAGLQEAAGIGVRMYLSGSSTNTPSTSSFDDLLVEGP
ncbi:PKD domain-containing protein [Paeniglutamicibacter antarcticus]|uniref:PKD domain-containing protein n=1 Tax=Paeniglutamicibacter antarcticus TaxID=494023 RepID=A0ABP9TPV2_9MICC